MRIPSVVKHLVRAATVALLAAGCATPVSHEVRALAVGGDGPASRERSKASLRARAALAPLMAVDAVAFTYHGTSGASRLETATGDVEIAGARVDYERVGGRLVAVATATRPPELVARLGRLASSEVSCSLAHDDPTQSFGRARMRALAQAVRASLPDPDASVLARGRLTLVTSEESLREDGVDVRYRVHVALDETRPLTDAEATSLLWTAVDDHRALHEWRRAVETLERLLAAGHDVPRLHALLGEALLESGRPDEALAEIERALAATDAPDASLRALHERALHALGEPVGSDGPTEPAADEAAEPADAIGPGDG